MYVDEAHLDPNDPRNAKFLSLLQSVPITTTTTTTQTIFRLRQLHEKERFVGDEEFANERRFALLEHRQQGVSSAIHIGNAIYYLLLSDQLYVISSAF